MPLYFLPVSLPALAVRQAAPGAPAPGVPAALFVPDRFARAVHHQSSAPYYLIATLVNDATGETVRGCIDGPQLFFAVRLQNKLGRGDWGGSQASRDKTKRLILDNTARTYHFTNPEAWKIAQPRYSPEMVALAQKELSGLSVPEIAARFDYDKTGGLVVLENTPYQTSAELFGYCAALAFVCTERGLLMGRGDFGNGLYVVTPAVLAEEDRREKERAEYQRRSDAEGVALVRRTSGYDALAKRYRIKRPDIGEHIGRDEAEDRYTLNVTLLPKTSGVVTEFDVENPVSKTEQKARYDWSQLLPIFAHAERLAKQFAWLRVWKNSGPNRRIEAQIYGKTLNTEYERSLHEDIWPAWKNAGLRGVPYMELRLRWTENDEGANATIYLPLPNSGETRALIVASRRPPHAAGTTGAGKHWLDNLSFRSDAVAENRQVIIVSPNGDWKLLSLPQIPKTK